jgi:cyclophilin family peptidyl-prolyl cis-trans isomerase
MRKLIISATIVLLILSQSLVFSQGFPENQNDPVLAKILELGKTDNRTMQWLDYLTNRFGTRISGTDGYTNAAQWAMYEFHKWGVQAELQEAGEVPVGFSHGLAYGKITAPAEKFLFFNTPAYSAGTKGIQRGPAVVVPADSQQIIAMKDRLKGAWVLVSSAVEFNRSPGRGQKSPMTNLLEAAGALGAISQGAKMPWTVRSNTVNSWDQLPVLPEITLLDTQYNEIKKLLEDGQKVELEFEIRNAFKMGPVKYHNIIAWLPGTDYPDEAVIMSGHFDTVAGSTGAVDCGSGATPAMEAIRLLAKAGAKTKRTVMVHLFAAEEKGILGSQAWLKQNPSRIPKIAALINRDQSPSAIVGATVPQSWYADFEKITRPLVNLNPEFPFALESTPYPGLRSVRPSGTDASAFSMVGVPTLRLRQKTEHVYRSTYHTAWDTYADVLPYTRHQEHTALSLAVMAYGIANLDHLLPRADVYLPDGMYADITTAKGRIIVSLDYENAPETVKGFIKLFETAEGAPGGQRPPAGPPAQPPAGQPQPPPQPVGAFQIIDANAAAQAEITLAATKARAAAKLPVEKNTAIAHTKAGILGMISPTQFYITSDKKPDYDKKYIAIGTVIADIKVVGALARGDAITRITINRVGQKALDFGR